MKANIHDPVHALILHVKLWTWLAENPSKPKHEWPGFTRRETYGGFEIYYKDDLIWCSCFICEASVSCEKCLLHSLWGSNCIAHDSAYNMWRRSDETSRVEYARLIANAGIEELNKLKDQGIEIPELDKEAYEL